jgi:hypothetical protein
MSVVSWSHIPQLRKSLAHYRGKLDLCRNQTEMYVKPARKLLTFLRDVVCRLLATRTESCSKRFSTEVSNAFSTSNNNKNSTLVVAERDFILIRYYNMKGRTLILVHKYRYSSLNPLNPGGNYVHHLL